MVLVVAAAPPHADAAGAASSRAKRNGRRIRAILANENRSEPACGLPVESLTAGLFVSSKRTPNSSNLLLSQLRILGRRRAAAGTGAVLVCVLSGLLFAGCGSSRTRASATSSTPTSTLALGPVPRPDGDRSGGPGAVANVYSADNARDLSPVVRGDPALVYVPNSMSNTVDVISQRTLKIVEQFPVGALPQHVTPSYDLRTLYVDNDLGNSLTPINPRTARPGRPIPVEDPYNLYFTPDGRFAIVVAERLQRLDFRDPVTMRLVRSLPVPACRGVDHMDFSADGRFAFASCEFAGRMIEIDLSTQRVIRTLVINHGVASPQDVKLSPDGRTLYTADQENGGLWEIDPYSFRVIGFLRTGARRPRPIPEPERASHVRRQSPGGVDLGGQLPDAPRDPHLAAPAAREP